MHFQNIFIDPIVSARKKAEKRDRHEERERKKERDVLASTPSSVWKFENDLSSAFDLTAV